MNFLFNPFSDKNTLTASTSLKEVGSQAAEKVEKELVIKSLKETHWNRREVARRLGVSYKCLRNKLAKWKMNKPE